MDLLGIFLQTAYRLHRHRLATWSLARWLGFLLLAVALIAAIAHPSLWAAAVLAGLALAYGTGLGWSARQGYVLFTATPRNGTAPQWTQIFPPLRREESYPVRASGWFTVEGKVQYYVDVDADLQATALGEYIIMGRIPASRFLWLGAWPEDEIGWWYIFFFPERVLELEVGCVRFGSQSRPALRLVYSQDPGNRQTIHLAFEDDQSLQRLRAGLTQDVQNATAPQAEPDGKA